MLNITLQDIYDAHKIGFAKNLRILACTVHIFLLFKMLSVELSDIDDVALNNDRVWMNKNFYIGI